MSAPLSYDRVLAALRRFFPFPVVLTRLAGALPAIGDSKIGRELGSIAWVFARVSDRVEAMKAELFPDTATESIDRWEFVTRVASIAADDISVRRNKTLSTLRRQSGVQTPRIAKALATVLACADTDLQFFETMRAPIDAMLTYDPAPASPIAIPTAHSIDFEIVKPYPGLVDDTGVLLTVHTSALGTPTYSLVHADGTSYALPMTSATQTFDIRGPFTGKAAGAGWRLRMMNPAGVNLVDFTIRISNDADAGQIYTWFCYRDTALPGTPDVGQAERIFNRTALGHMNGRVVQEMGFGVGDPLCGVGHNPVGTP